MSVDASMPRSFQRGSIRLLEETARRAALPAPQPRMPKYGNFVVVFRRVCRDRHETGRVLTAKISKSLLCHCRMLDRTGYRVRDEHCDLL